MNLFFIMLLWVCCLCFISCSNTYDDLSISELLVKYGSDKELHHGYSRYYEPHLEPLRSKPIRLLEIGVEQGNSTTTWQTYFKRADHIYGIGYGNWQDSNVKSIKCQENPYMGVILDRESSSSEDDITIYGKDNCTLFYGDQSDTTFLGSFLQISGGNFDIIIDDGSHFPPHQIISFEALWDSVKPGGLYFIEDIETSYWKRGAKVYSNIMTGEISVIDHFKKVSDQINREFTRDQVGGGLISVYNTISSITFGQNIIILKKQGVSEMEKYFNRVYRYAQVVR